MPNKEKFDQKSVSVYISRKTSNIARALEVLARRSGIKESDLLKECFKEHCAAIGLYRQPTEDSDDKGQWNINKIEKLEAKYPPRKKTRLNKDVVDD